MSLDYNFYVGPYLKCQYHLVNNSRERFTCANYTCPSSGNDLEHTGYKFCPICGRGLESIQIIKQEPDVNIWDFTRRIDERLYAANVKSNDNCHYLISNIGDGTPGIHLSLGTDTLIMPLVADDWVQRFGEIFGNEIASAKEVYDKIEVEIGVLFWWD